MPTIFADSARLTGVIGLIIGLVGALGTFLTPSEIILVTVPVSCRGRRRSASVPSSAWPSAASP